MNPILFLDVDGVLNVLGHREYEMVTSGGGATWSPPGTRERVGRLLEWYDLVWATAWRGAANPHFRTYLGLGECPYLNWQQYKLPEIVRFSVERPWAWVDDDSEFELRHLGIAWRSFEDSPSTRIVTPHSSVGLTDEHVDALIDFARSVSL